MSQNLPDWMRPPLPAKKQTPAALRREARNIVYESLFDKVLDALLDGQPMNMRAILDDHGFADEYNKFLRWLHKDETREAQLYETQRISSHVLEQTLNEKMNDEERIHSPESLRLLQLNMEWTKWRLGVYHRKRYGDVKQVELNQTVSITRALDRARGRLINGVSERVEDAEGGD